MTKEKILKGTKVKVKIGSNWYPATIDRKQAKGYMCTYASVCCFHPSAFSKDQRPSYDILKKTVYFKAENIEVIEYSVYKELCNKIIVELSNAQN